MPREGCASWLWHFLCIFTYIFASWSGFLLFPYTLKTPFSWSGSLHLTFKALSVNMSKRHFYYHYFSENIKLGSHVNRLPTEKIRLGISCNSIMKCNNYDRIWMCRRFTWMQSLIFSEKKKKKKKKKKKDTKNVPCFRRLSSMSLSLHYIWKFTKPTLRIWQTAETDGPEIYIVALSKKQTLM